MANADARLNPRQLQAAACSGMLVFGIVMALIGALLPALAARLSFDVSRAGSLFLWMNASMLASSLLLGALMDRYGLKAPLAAGPALTAAALLLFLRAGSFESLLPAAALLGAGGAAVNAGSNTLIADLHPDPAQKGAALNWLGVFFGFGALLLPLGLGALVETAGAGPVLAAAAALCLAAGVAASLPRYPAPKRRDGLRLAEVPGLLRSPTLSLAGALLFFQSGIEFTLGGYLTLFLTRQAGLSIPAASWALAGYWAALMLARVLLSRRPARKPHFTVLACALASAACVLVAAASPGAALAVAALIASGAALAGIFPTVLGILGARFVERSGTVFGLAMAMALCGGITLPWTAAHLAASFGLRWVLVMVAAAFCAIAALGFALRAARVRAA